jgi:hypothetical protein
MALCYCLALCCRRRHIRPLRQAWLHHQIPRRQSWPQISSDSPLSTVTTLMHSICPYPTGQHANPANPDHVGTEIEIRVLNGPPSGGNCNE